MPVRDKTALKLRGTIGGYIRRGNLAAAEHVRRELQLHNLRAHIARVQPTPLERAALFGGGDDAAA